MAPLLLRAFIMISIASAISATIIVQIAAPDRAQALRDGAIETANRLTEIEARLLSMQGTLRQRLRQITKQRRDQAWLCPLKGGKVRPGPATIDGEIVLFRGRGPHVRRALSPPLRQLIGRRATKRGLCLHIQHQREQRRRNLMIALALGLLVGLVGLFVPLTRRLRNIEAVVHRVAEGDLRARTMDQSKDAIGSLAQGVDQIGERIEALLAGQRQMHASVSHELRTPLARLAAAIDLAEDHPNEKLFDGMRTDIRELDLLVDELLTLSRLQDPSARAALNDIDLSRLASERFDAVQRGDQRQLNWSFEGDENLRLRGDARLLARLLDNLLNNAARHAESAVSLRLSKSVDGTLIEVADDGPGITEEQRPTLFDPFVSASPGGSAGLGLAICREIADLHGGTLGVATSDLGGASFRLVLT